MITQAELKEVLSYNPETGDFTWLVANCNRIKIGGVAGYVRVKDHGKKYREIGIAGKLYQAHRLAFLYMDGSFPPNYVDHINGNGMDNKWENLRHATNQENQRNQRLFINSSSGFTGVSWSKRSNKWRAHIMVNGKTINLGCFKEIADAVTERQKANIKYGFHSNHGSIRPL